MDAFCRFNENQSAKEGDVARCAFMTDRVVRTFTNEWGEEEQRTGMCWREGSPDFETPERFRDAWLDQDGAVYSRLQDCIDAILPCVRGFLSKDWLGFSQGEIFTPATPDASYGLAIRWCTVPGKSTSLDFADIRVEDNRVAGKLDAFGRALEKLTIEVSQQWVRNKSRKVKTEGLPGGGMRVTAATGHFDVCVGLGGLIGGVGKRAFKALPRGARDRLVRALRESATNEFERAYDRTYKKVKEELVGKTNPATGKRYTKEARRKVAEQVAGAGRRLHYDLLDRLLERLVELDFKACLRAWTPKITATITVDGTATMIETGSFRGSLWRVFQDDRK